MNFVGVENAWLELEKSVLLQAIEDFVTLKAKGVIYNGDKVAEHKFSQYRRGSSRHPLNYSTPKEVYDLIWFLKSSWLDLFCVAIGHKACRLRKRIGIIPGAEEVLTVSDLDYWHRSAVQKNRHLI